MSKDGRDSDAVVIGAGIVGICTALELSKSGYNVTVIERFPLAGQFASMANAGIVRLHTPLPFKSISSQFHSSQELQALKSLSPSFKPNYKTSVSLDPYFFSDITSYKWMYFYFKSKFKKHNHDRLDGYSFNSFLSNTKEVYNTTGYDFQSNGGYATIYPSPLASLVKNSGNNVYHDFTQTKATSFENSSANALQQRVGNLKLEVFPSSFISDCHKFTNLVANGAGCMNDIHFRFNTKATEILVNKENNVCGVTLDDNTSLSADKVVICAGVLTNNIVENSVYQVNDKNVKRKMKLPYIPIVPLQGFSITLPYAPKNRWKYPYHTMEYYPTHLYASRINDQILRFSAYGYFRSSKYATKMWDEMGQNMVCKEGVQGNLENMERHESELLDNMESCIKDNLLSLYDIDEKYFDEHKIRWKGFRPYTPDEMPIVDQVGDVNGLYVNAGHGFLGWGTAHGTAKLVTKLMSQKLDEDETNMLKLLSLDRF
eukprot:144056_1